jgi:diguanylate cyclase (GGDEF)-like protein/PAS domain S-box-containing protein
MSTDNAEDVEALLQFMYLAPIGLVQARGDGEILMANPLSAQLLMPLSRDGGLSNLFEALQSVAPDLRHQVQAHSAPHGLICDAVHLHVNAGQPGRKEAQILSLSLLKLDGDRLMAVLGDATLSVRRDRELRQSQAWINTLVSGLSDYALVALDERGCAASWNPSIARVTGFGATATVGRSMGQFYPADSMPEQRVLDRLHEADSSGWSLDEGWRQRADGSRFWGSCLIAPLHEADARRVEERAYSLIIRDVSDRREATEALWRSVSCDHLTGLANRRAFFETAGLELQRWARAPRPVSLLLIDADHFKRINDAHGHAAGDAVLRHLAAAMSASFRAMDMLARLGGEEFVVLLPGTPLDGAAAVAERLCRRLAEQAVVVDGRAIPCTVSIGVATMDTSIDGVDALVQRADRAMYAAKALGRNRVERWHAALPGSVPVAQAAHAT